MIGMFILPIKFAIFSIPSIVLLTCLFIINIKNSSFVFTIFANKRFVFIGKISYSLYLWHWGIITLSLWTIGIYWWTIPFQIIIIYLLAIFSYSKIETPIRNNSFYKFNNIKPKFISIALFIVLFLVLGILKLQQSAFFYLGNKSYAEEEKTSHPPNNFFIDNRFIEKKLIVLGDSHAGHFWGMLENSNERNARKLIMHIRDKGFHEKVPSSNEDYDHFIGDVFKYYFKTMNQNDIVFLSVDGRLEPVRASVKKAFIDVIELSNKKNIKVVIANQTPYLENKLKRKSYLLC